MPCEVYDMFIERTIEKICEEDLSGYYRPLKAMHDALGIGYVPLIYWIIGARRIGKTDFFLHLACRLFMDFGVQTMWIRNKQVELSEPGFYNDFLNDAKHFGWCPEDWYSDSSGVWTEDKQQVIKWQSLSTFSNRRGAAHPDVYMMIYDEFIPESRDYPRRPLTALMSLTKSVFAGKREARLFCLSNFVSLTNPFFAGLRIYPEGEITHYPEKGMLIEKCRGYRCSIEHDNPWQNVYKAAKYGDYQDETEDKLIELVKKLPKKAKSLNYALVIKGEYYAPFHNGKYVHWAHVQQLPYGTLLFATEITEVSDRIPLLPDLLKKNIEICVKNDAIRFDSPNTLYTIMSLIYNV